MMMGKNTMVRAVSIMVENESQHDDRDPGRTNDSWGA